ncbi:unnamed protein product [Lathyrus oleraceus]
MAYYNQNPPPINVNVSAPPPVGYPQPGYQGYPPPQPQVFVTQAAPQNSAAAQTGLMACLAGLCCCCCLEETCCLCCI